MNKSPASAGVEITDAKLFSTPYYVLIRKDLENNPIVKAFLESL